MWRDAARLFLRPQKVTLPMVALALIVPGYLVIGYYVSSWPLYAPDIALDRALAVDPAWSAVYLSLFLAALLPAFVLHQQELIRRTVLAYILAWLVASAIFLAYPTIGPRSLARPPGDGFNDWLLRTIYSADHRYNCFPSLHVAQPFIAALACWTVHRGVGVAALAWASLVGISTVFTKQHYVLDAVAGALLGFVAYRVFIHGYPRESTPEHERRLAPHLATGAVATYGVMVFVMWIAYLDGFVP